MNIVLPFSVRDTDQTLRWLNWNFELNGRQDKHVLFLLPQKGLDYNEAKAAALKAFKTVNEIKDGEGVTSDWNTSTAPYRDAGGPNSLFRQAAWHFMLQKLGAWLFCEPDCVPLKPEAFDLIEAEYLRAKKPFMGCIVDRPNFVPYINGAAVYHQETPKLAPSIVTITETRNPQREIVQMPFDVAGAKEMLKQTHCTSLIQCKWNKDGSENVSSMAEIYEAVTKECVLFHGDRNGTWISTLREAKKPKAEPVVAKQPREGEENNGMIWWQGAWHPKVQRQASGQLSMQDHVKALAEYARGDGFAKGRIFKALRAVDLVPKAEPTMKAPEKKRGRGRPRKVKA